MLVAFQVCFYVGVALTIIFLIMGQFFDFLGVDGLDFGFAGIEVMLPLSPTIYILAITIFGGGGLIFLNIFPDMPILLVALLSGAIGILCSTLFYQCIIKPLKKAQNTSAPEREELIGLPAKVTETIQEKGYGEISYMINGNSYIAPAKSISEEEIKKGTEVAICQIEEYVFYVTKIPEDTFLSKND